MLVVGAGPAGSIAALVLARAGGQVALLDKAPFPRDKACGDFVGPRGLQVLADLGVPEPPGLDVGDMVVVGPTGRRVVLPCFDGAVLPGAGPGRAPDRASTPPCGPRRSTREPCPARAGPTARSGRDPISRRVRRDRRRASSGPTSSSGPTAPPATWPPPPASSRAPGCSGGSPCGATSTRHVELPAITLWEQTRWHAFPGYGWIFPGPGGVANVGIGIGTLADRQSGAGAVRALPAYLRHLVDLGLLDRCSRPMPLPRRLGGWLKMGMVGTTPASGRVLLVGDAAGLVNPLQGEGIAQATDQRAGGRRGDPRPPPVGPPPITADQLARAHLPYQRITAAGHAALVGRPAAVAAVGRLLTAPVDRPGPGRWMGDLLERAARRCSARSGPRCRRGVDRARSGGHGPHRGVPLVRRGPSTAAEPDCR